MTSKTQEIANIEELEALLGDMPEIEAESSDSEVTEPTETVETVEAVEAVAEEAAPVAGEKPKKDKSNKKTKQGKKVKAAKAPKEPKPAAEPKAPKEPRVFFGKDKVRRLSTTVTPDFLVLTTADAMLEGEALASAQAATKELIGKMGDKVKNRATNLIEAVAGRGKLNNISTTALNVLARDGFIQTGDKGNFHAALLAKPYSPAAARAMGNNTIHMMKDLKVLVGEKGRYVANPESVYLSVLAGQLALTFGATEQAVSEVTTEEAIAA
jgi:hypothetical protein